MKTIFAGIMIILFCCACRGGKEKVDVGYSSLAASDTLLSLSSDSLASEAESTVAIPKNADELFDDFIYNYASDERLQRARTAFPLLYIKDGVAQRIAEEEWTHDSLFSRESYYTLFYEKEEDMELEKNIELDSVTVEWIYLDSHEIRQYHFRRDRGIWNLNFIEQHSTLKEPYEDFLEFFYKFANDSVYQSEHIAKPLRFVTTDPDDEFQILETTLETGQWFAFRPLLPTKRMTNIDYGQKHRLNARQKILDLRGIGTGFSNTLFFRRFGTEWRLVQFDDLSN